MKKYLSIFSLLLLLTISACSSTPPASQSAADKKIPSIAELNAQRQVNGQPPLTWEEYVELTDPASNHAQFKNPAN